MQIQTADDIIRYSIPRCNWYGQSNSYEEVPKDHIEELRNQIYDIFLTDTPIVYWVEELPSSLGKFILNCMLISDKSDDTGIIEHIYSPETGKEHWEEKEKAIEALRCYAETQGRPLYRVGETRTLLDLKGE